MARQKPNIQSNLPARRRIMRWDGNDAPPMMVRKDSLPTGTQSRYASAPGSAPQPQRFGFGIIFRFLLIFLSIGILFAAKWLVDRFYVSSVIGEAPVAIEPMLPLLALPDSTPMGSATVVHKVRKNDTFGQIVSGYGVNTADAGALSDTFAADPANAKMLQAGRMLQFSFGEQGDLQSAMIEPEPGKQLVLQRNSDGGFTSSTRTIHTERGERVAVGIIDSSFSAAATKAGVRYDIVDDLVDLFSNRVEFRKDFHKGDRFTVVYRDFVLSDGRPAGGSEILAAALEVNGEHLVAARYVGSDGKARFFDEKGTLLGNTFLRYPLKFSRISSLFTTARFHPVLKVNKPHNGVDFAAPIGTPVRTVADGVVEMAGRNGGSGNMVKIRHNERYSTAYLHLSSIAKGMTKGARVRRGDLIGAVGMTGLATGPHLHFSFYDYGKYVDPLSIKLPTLDTLDIGTRINAEYLKRVLFTLDHYQTVELEHFYND